MKTGGVKVHLHGTHGPLKRRAVETDEAPEAPAPDSREMSIVRKRPRDVQSADAPVSPLSEANEPWLGVADPAPITISAADRESDLQFAMRVSQRLDIDFRGRQFSADVDATLEAHPQFDRQTGRAVLALGLVRANLVELASAQHGPRQLPPVPSRPSDPQDVEFAASFLRKMSQAMAATWFSESIERGVRRGDGPDRAAVRADCVLRLARDLLQNLLPGTRDDALPRGSRRS